MKKFVLIVSMYILVFGYSSLLHALEPWIDYDNLSTIELGANKEKVISSLGDPLLILANSEYDNTLYLFYNYHVKSSNKEHSSVDDKSGRVDKGRLTLIKFTIVDDSLVSWEEDKLTLSMSSTNNAKKNCSLLSYFSMFLNLVLLIKII